MDECFKCGITADKTLLMDAISNEGIVKICRKCSFDEDLPIIRKPSVINLKEPEKKETVYSKRTFQIEIFILLFFILIFRLN